MSENQKRRRASAMSTEARRTMIISTALPLVAEFGASVTTGQIARAAGIGEGTVFRAFSDKEELLGACLAEAMRPDTFLTQIADISLDEPLTQRLIEAANASTAHLARAGRVVDALQASSGRALRRGHGDSSDSDTAPPDRDAAHERTGLALAELFEPEADRLRLPSRQLGRLFFTALLANARAEPEEQPISVELWVDVFLHGALTTEEGTA